MHRTILGRVCSLLKSRQRGLATSHKREKIRSSTKLIEGTNVLEVDLRIRKKLVVSTEAIKVSGLLKKVRSDPDKLDKALKSDVLRLVKVDMLGVLNVFQEEEDAFMASKIFGIIQKEHWYKPHHVLFFDMIKCYCNSGLPNKFDEVAKLLDEIDRFGVYCKMVYFMAIKQSMLEQDFVNAKRFYEMMKSSKSNSDPGHYKAIIKLFSDAGLQDYAEEIRQDHAQIVTKTKKVVYKDDCSD